MLKIEQGPLQGSWERQGTQGQLGGSVLPPFSFLSEKVHSLPRIF